MPKIKTGFAVKELFFAPDIPPLPRCLINFSSIKLEKVPYGTIIILIRAEVIMATKVNCNIHWNINKAEPLMPVSVSLEQYETFINSHEIIYEIESIHRDDTDYKTYSVIGDKSYLIGWADYYHKSFYIYK
ncbi:hypothetical protein MWG99_24585 [Klebsiella pneumoniae]|uniref:hypothetical protein n=1 Tax=Klebsiella pneumoniae TaxID=573 RepID=UPI0012CDDF19|nr:hypothetical protein [Klebsiella pneumoniae]EDH8331304.1 hypothetical protein [Salmonella enterica subsp. enterica serovar Java]EDI2356227.1 hypothetical protein [Salmonella enterica subsp. enterica serovar Heidelberg]EJT3740366.1 hypothetical protein [Salmonella enterica]HBC1521251.1 hypothetical protein [Escherichia coli]HCT0762643.1 hypothetical protein [Salmonella enterica subsp. enterica serovar 1,4,[5],12:i:-]